MSAFGLTIDALARDNDAQGLAALIKKGRHDQGDLNFGFQAACESGSVSAAAMLLPLCGIVSVSRGLRKAAWRGSAECTRLAAGRLRAEAAFDEFDLALALRDVDLRAPGGVECARLIWEEAPAWATAFALREHISTGSWSKASALLEAGAPMDCEVGAARAGGAGDRFSTPRAAWDARLASSPKPSEGGAAGWGGPAMRAIAEGKLLREEAFKAAVDRIDSGAAPEGFPEPAEGRRLRI